MTEVFRLKITRRGKKELDVVVSERIDEEEKKYKKALDQEGPATHDQSTKTEQLLAVSAENNAGNEIDVGDGDVDVEDVQLIDESQFVPSVTVSSYAEQYLRLCVKKSQHFRTLYKANIL